MKYGYARVSNVDQHPDLQIQALKKAGCKQIYTDKISGVSNKRPQLDKCLKALKQGDVLVVWKLDRLGRSLSHLVSMLDAFKVQGVQFVSLTEAINTETPAGRFLSHMIAALAEFERSLIVERTQSGLKAAKRRGIRLGRKPKLSPEQIAHAKKLTNAGESAFDVARILKVARSTVYKSIGPGPW